MAIHTRNLGTGNPRLQCSVCGKWKRLHGSKPQPPYGLTQNFFGSCPHNHGGDHLAGDRIDVCARCCEIECKRLAEAGGPRAPTLVTRAFVVDDPWAGLILDGRKSWEMRTGRTRIRGTVGIIKSGSGVVSGVVDIVDSLGPFTPEQLARWTSRHHMNRADTLAGKFTKWNHAWVLARPIRFEKPIPYRHPSGAVIWVGLTPDVTKAIQRAMKHTCR